MHELKRQALRARIRALSVPLQPRRTALEALVDPLPGIRAILFDVYGTLVISASGDIGLAGEQDEAAALRAAWTEAGIEAPPGTGPRSLGDAIRRAHVRRREAGVEFPEVDIRAIWCELLGSPHAGAPFTGRAGASGPAPDPAAVERLAVEYECRVNPVWPMPGLGQLLAGIRERGLVLGIVSNAQFYTPLMLEAFLGRGLHELGFDPACCAFSYRLLEAKPSTRIYREALAGLRREHGIAPEAVLYVGNDIRNDIWPASRVGCRTALFAGDERSLRLRRADPRCAGVQPERVVTDLRQVTAALLSP
jgi:putative hydrolase of the HAD superfamily